MRKTEEIDYREFRKRFGGGSASTWEARIVKAIPLTVCLTVPVKLFLSRNESDKEHWAERAKRLADMTENMQALMIVHKLPKFKKAEIRIVHYFRVDRARDYDNYGSPKKFIDSLRYCTLIAGDDSKVLKLHPPEFRIDPKNPRTEVFVQEWEGDPHG
jgi:hypothetical protein